MTAPPARSTGPWRGRILAALGGAGAALLAAALAPRPAPAPLPTDRSVEYWLQADAEGAFPTRLERDDLRFRAHTPFPRLVLHHEHLPRPEMTGVVVPVRIENLNRDLAALAPDPRIQDARWPTPTTFEAKVQIPPNESTVLEFRDAAPSAPTRFFVAGDPELNFAVLDRVLADARRERPAFVWVVGDLIQELDWVGEHYLRRFETAEVPVYVTIGNHDIVHDRKRGPFEARKEHFRRVFGPTDYAFDFRGAQFVALDTAAPYVLPSQLDWLERTLAQGEERPRVVLSHKPWVDPRPGLSHGIENVWDAERLQGILARTPRVQYYCGHVAGYYVYEAGGVPVTIAGTLTRQDLLEEDPGGRNGYIDVRLGEDGRPAAERVELEPAGRLVEAWGMARVAATEYPRHHPEGPVGGLLLAGAAVGALRAWRRGRKLRRASREG